MDPLFPPPPFPTGQILNDHYKILDVLGQGGFGRTYRAENLKRFQEICVLKEFVPKLEIQQDAAALQKAQELFQREAQVLYGLSHPQIPRFQETWSTVFQGQPRLILVQDWIEGESYRGQVLAEGALVQWLADVLEVLAYLHSRTPPVIHRDISPDNLIYGRHIQKPVLIDFGAVKELVSQSAGQRGTVIGKQGYCPIEQQQGKACAASDLYALGVTAIVLLTGRSPSSLRNSRGQWCWRSQVTVSKPLGTLLDRLIADSLAQRYRTVTQVQRDLAPLLPLATPPAAVTVPSPAVPAPHGQPRPTPTPGAGGDRRPLPKLVSSFMQQLEARKYQGDWVYGLWQGLQNAGMRRFLQRRLVWVGGLTVAIALGGWGWNGFKARSGGVWPRLSLPVPGFLRPAQSRDGEHPCDLAEIQERYDALDAVMVLPDLGPAIDDLFYEQFPEKIVQGQRQPITEQELDYAQSWCELADQWLSDQGG